MSASPTARIITWDGSSRNFFAVAKTADYDLELDRSSGRVVAPFPSAEIPRNAWHIVATGNVDQAVPGTAFLPQIRADQPLETYYSMLIKPMHEMLSSSSGYPSVVVVFSQPQNEPSTPSEEYSFITMKGASSPSFLAGDYTSLTMTYSAAEGLTDISLSNVDNALAEYGAKFTELRNEIRSFQYLPMGWDTYKARPLSVAAINNALTLLDRLEEAEIIPDLVLPTSDDSIYFRFTKGQQIFEYELFSDGENVKIKINPNGRHEYFDLISDELTKPL